MKVYYEVLPTWLGRVIYRINRELKKYAPSSVEFVNDPKQADLQILDFIGVGSIPFLYVKKYIVLQECYITSEESTEDFWMPYWKAANLVVSFSDLSSLVRDKNFNFYRSAWGVDPNVFYKTREYKDFSILSTGYVAETECIGETLAAVQRTGWHLNHVGGNLFTGARSYSHFENISDEQLRSLYDRSAYTVGMRKMEGFELPLVEGLLCGSRGITLDYPSYRYWYGDLVEYIKDGDFDYVTKQLITLLKGNYRNVTQEEIEYTKNKFNWETICKNVWKKIEESL